MENDSEDNRVIPKEHNQLEQRGFPFSYLLMSRGES